MGSPVSHMVASPTSVCLWANERPYNPPTQVEKCFINPYVAPKNVFYNTNAKMKYLSQSQSRERSCSQAGSKKHSKKALTGKKKETSRQIAQEANLLHG